MRVTGMKLTHGEAIALVENGRLVFCIELEKGDKSTASAATLPDIARLQTIARSSPDNVAELLVEHEKITGMPLLGNTSANCHEGGFFPSEIVACGWGRIQHGKMNACQS
ncbi:L-threonylcarbamoyladenylate synthase [Rhizobium acaciae]|uniref:hypothetical protein n=1 Tax=Rhizobium acaciae TaxID=2989736 RepID=UPI00387324E0